MDDTTAYLLVTLATLVGGLLGWAARCVATKLVMRREARYVEWTPADAEWLDTWDITP